ncbi:MAG: reverse transcriptase domain-containing protein [Rikenellaceae bacterium]
MAQIHKSNKQKRNNNIKEKPKTTGDLLEDIFTAYFDARKNKRNTKRQVEFEMNLEENLIKLYHEVKNRTYKPSPSICFIVNKPVKREIFASEFKDRIIHHLLHNYIAPQFEKTFIHDSYSCRKEKGTHFGIKRLQHHIRSCTNNYKETAHILKLDIQGYFMSINKQKLQEIVTTRLFKIWTKKQEKNFELILFLIKQIITKKPAENCVINSPRQQWNGLPKTKSLFHNPSEIGLPIGDLTSQLFSNIYLGELDDYIKRELKIKHYGRYVDDFYIIDKDKEKLKGLIKTIKTYLVTKLEINLHPQKIYLQEYTKGVHFLGAMIKPYRKQPVKRCVKSYMETINKANKICSASKITPKTTDKILATINSFCGHLGTFDAYKLKKRTLQDHNLNKFFDIAPDYAKITLKEELKRKPQELTQELIKIQNNN